MRQLLKEQLCDVFCWWLIIEAPDWPLKQDVGCWEREAECETDLKKIDQRSNLDPTTRFFFFFLLFTVAPSLTVTRTHSAC